MDRYDVVVIGAGLAGLQCASLLGKQGISVLLVERKTSLTKPIHTTGIFQRRTLGDFDLPKDCLGPSIRHITLYSPARRRLIMEGPRDAFRIGRMDQLYLHYLKECQQAGVVWMPNTHYLGCEGSKDASILHLNASGHARNVRAYYIVGADGAMSHAARDLRLSTNREWIMGVEDVLRDVAVEGPPCFHCFLDVELSPGYVAWVAYDGYEVHLGVGGYISRFNPIRALETFRTSITGIIDLGRAKHIERRGGRIPVGGTPKHIANQRGLLVGDAAGAPSPLFAGGFDSCMRLSRLAAQVIIDYLTTGNAQALIPYVGTHLPTHSNAGLCMRRLISSIQHQSMFELAHATFHFPLFHWIVWQVIFGQGPFPDKGLV